LARPNGKGQRPGHLQSATKSVVLGQTLETLYQRQITVPSVVARYQQLGAKFTDWKTAGFPSTLMTGSKGDFGPRVGFAYRAFDGKKAFVIRGGYSLAYYPVPETRWMDYDRGNVPFNATFQFNMNSAAQTPDGLPNWTIRSTPSVIAGVNSRNVVTMDNPQGITRGAGGLQYFGPDQPTSRTHQWNLSLEKEIMAYTVGRVRYVGNHAATSSSSTLTTTTRRTTSGTRPGKWPSRPENSRPWPCGPSTTPPSVRSTSSVRPAGPTTTA